MALDGWRRAALRAFTNAMEHQLGRAENLSKGAWEDAEREDLPRMMNEVWYHAAKLQKALEKLDAFTQALEDGTTDKGEPTLWEHEHAVLEFACDVANCALIVADVSGALEHSEDDAVGERGEGTIGWQPDSGRY